MAELRSAILTDSLTKLIYSQILDAIKSEPVGVNFLTSEVNAGFPAFNHINE